MDQVLSTDEKRVLKMFETENGNGKFVDDEFLRRKLGASPFEGGLDGFGITEQMINKGAVIKYTYSDHNWYIANIRAILQVIIDKPLASEYSNIAAAISNASSSGQKNLLKLKRSILDTIQNDLNNRIEEFSKNSETSSKDILNDDNTGNKLADILLDLIKHGTNKFYESTAILDLIDKDKLFSGELLSGDMNYSNIGEVMNALIEVGDVIEAPTLNKNSFYLTKDIVNTAFVKKVEAKLKLISDEIRQKSLTPKDIEYKYFLQLDGLVKILNKNITPNTTDIESLGISENMSIDSTDDIPKEENETVVQDSTTVVSNENPVVEPEEVSVDKIDNEDVDVETQLFKLIKFKSSKEILKSYIDQIINGENSEIKSEYFKTLFSSLAVLIKLPEKNSQELYTLSKSLLNKLENYTTEDIAMKQLMDLEQSYETYTSNKMNEYFFDKR